MMTRRIFYIAASLLGLGTESVAAQSCPAGPADSVPNAGQPDSATALRWIPAIVKDEIPPVLQSLGYHIDSVDSAKQRFVTRPSKRYPEDLPGVFRRYKHPGVVVTVLVQPAGDSTHLHVLARALCAVAQPPPPGYSVKVEDTIELSMAMEVWSSVVKQLMRNFSRRFQ